MEEPHTTPPVTDGAPFEVETITTDMPIAEAGRALLAEQLAIVYEHWPMLVECADVTAVHETRKAIRRSFTLFKLFTPYFKPGALDDYRAGLRAIMRRLAPCRDIAVFRGKLEQYNLAAAEPLLCLSAHWEAEQDDADAALQRYVARRKTGKFLRRYYHFVTTPGKGVGDDPKQPPLLVRHAAPALLFQRLGAVRAYGDLMAAATPAQFHRLRIQFKELRYTLQSFEPVLGQSAAGVIEASRRLQEHLGHMNDAAVAGAMLEGMKGCPDEAAVYRDVQAAETARLMAGFPALYAEFDSPAVRDQLALAVVHL